MTERLLYCSRAQEKCRVDPDPACFFDRLVSSGDRARNRDFGDLDPSGGHDLCVRVPHPSSPQRIVPLHNEDRPNGRLHRVVASSIRHATCTDSRPGTNSHRPRKNPARELSAERERRGVEAARRFSPRQRVARSWNPQPTTRLLAVSFSCQNRVQGDCQKTNASEIIYIEAD